jgi:hypothetical protein
MWVHAKDIESCGHFGMPACQNSITPVAEISSGKELRVQRNRQGTKDMICAWTWNRGQTR